MEEETSSIRIQTKTRVWKGPPLGTISSPPSRPQLTIKDTELADLDLTLLMRRRSKGYPLAALSCFD